MEIFWRWSILNQSEKLKFTSFVVTEVIETLDITDSVYSLLLASLLSFLKKEGLIASIFFESLFFFELELLKKSKFARLALDPNSVNFELLCKLYDFIPLAEIKYFINQERKTYQKPQNVTECLHFIKCNSNLNVKNESFFDYLMFEGKKTIEENKHLFIEHLIFHPQIADFYSDEQYVKSFIKKEFQRTTKNNKDREVYFIYDVHFVPEIPNQLFLTQLFNSMDKVCIHKKFVPLLLNHLQNLEEDGYLFDFNNTICMGIIAKMVLYKLSSDANKWKLFLDQKKSKFLETNGFICFLVNLALQKPVRWNLLKIFLLI